MLTTGILTIGVFTANRAEYGLLVPVLQHINTHPHLSLCLIVGPDHWQTGTIDEIIADGFTPQVAIKPPPSHTLTPGNMPPDAGQRMCALAGHVINTLPSQLPPHLHALIILGDRFEAAACALACRLLDLPILHIGGGDITEGGCVDDDLRHSISQLATWHATSTHASTQRLIHRGIAPERILTAGSLVVDNLHTLALIPKATLWAALGLNADLPTVLFTQHPIPAEGPATLQHFQDSLTALSRLPVQVLATYPNQDGYGRELLDIIAHNQHPNFRWVPSLGRHRYLSAMSACTVVAGNTSSGLIESPFFGKPNLCIGPRQQGREHASNVLFCDYGINAVTQGINTLLHDPQWATNAHTAKANNPFGQAPAAPAIVAWLVEKL
jgi:UDP-hydrolysing UDP-N-acetyl-D-glucosamine 2-epimerase